MPTTEDLVLELLTDAATAHGIHEKNDLGGVFDQQWPQWYAAHITRALAERGYRIAPAPKGTTTMELKFEVTVIPVADVDRAKAFYEQAGFRLDADFTSPKGLRVVQATPPQSAASIIFGEHLTDQTPGSARGLHLITSDLQGARDELIARGIEVSPVWHDADGVFHWAGDANRVEGAGDAHDSYASYASFADPDGNEWIIQQIITRAPGREW